MKNQFDSSNGKMLATCSNTRITKKIDIIITDTNEKSCSNCKGFGEECDNGGAWIYCEIRNYHDSKFDGDCGETKGCQFHNFPKPLKDKVHEYEWLSKAFALNASLYTTTVRWLFILLHLTNRYMNS